LLSITTLAPRSSSSDGYFRGRAIGLRTSSPEDQILVTRSPSNPACLKYLYVGQDPINLIDPSGLTILDDIDSVTRSVTNFYTEYIRDPLVKTGGGRCLLGAAIYGGGAYVVSKDYRISAGVAIVGCALGITRKGF
ncbi:MAG TPA: hypothetical protein VMY78_12945, partial [Solirubrobacteraceae bacterium]|nr:hypothetical protein [Solirubrobacteraceae bacterium]